MIKENEKEKNPRDSFLSLVFQDDVLSFFLKDA